MKKLIPAIAMTLVAAAMFATSTFAWFSMNTQVTADGMQVQAKSENIYLLISSEKTTATEIQAENQTSTGLGVTDTAAKLFPAAPVLTDTEAGYLTTAGKTTNGTAITTAGAKITDKTSAELVTNWYTATAESPNASTMKDGSARQLAAFTDYVIKKTIYLTVAAGSQNAGNLKVTPSFEAKTTGKDISAAKILLATSDGACVVLDSTMSTAQDIKGNNTAITSSSVLTIDLYIYYDGTEENVYTNKVADLSGATISLSFTAEYVA